ncbi:MAG: AraC family transcriptional regulator [Rikenellaceae bacterium]
MSSTHIINGLKYNTIECRYFPKPTLTEPAEIELIYITRGEGVCFANDGITPFHTGDILLFSGHMSHYLRSAKQFYSPQYPLRCGATTIQFERDLLPANLDTLRECDNIARVVEMARRGVRWCRGSFDPKIVEQIEVMEQLEGVERMLQLYHILDQLGRLVDRAEMIASEVIQKGQKTNNKGYLMTIEYIIRHFDQQITLDQLADHTNINKTALCRHFKAHAGRSIFDFLLELRINYAKELLASTKITISEVALDAGFNNPPNFNVQFKRLAGITPGEYRASHARRITNE